jgi:hypothetical protein
MLPMEKSVIFTGACANEIIPSINRSFVYKAKEGSHVRIYISLLTLNIDSITHINNTVFNTLLFYIILHVWVLFLTLYCFI